MASLSTVKTNDNNSSFQSMSSATVTAIDDVEISIFDAAKYFNEGLNDMKRQVDENSKKPSHDHHLLQPSLSSPAELGRRKSSTLSEASWSSQTALLLTASRRWSAAKKWFLRRRRRNCCSCSNGESIRVKEVIARPIVLMDTVKIKTSHADADADADDVVEIRRIRASEAPRQQRISATGRPFISAAVGFTFPILSSAAREDDAGSDASSDLFEIETFSAQTPPSSSCPIHCLCDSHAERKFAPASNGHRSRLSVSGDESRPAAGCDGELEEDVEEAGGGRGRRKSVDGAAEGPHLIPLPEKVRRGSSRSPPLVAAGG